MEKNLEQELELIEEIELTMYRTMNEARHSSTYQFAKKIWDEIYVLKQELKNQSKVTCPKCKGIGYLAESTNMVECDNCNGEMVVDDLVPNQQECTSFKEQYAPTS